MSQQAAKGEQIVLRVPDLARLFGCTPIAARRMVERGQVPGRRLGRRVIVLRDELDAALRALPRAPEAASH